MCTYTYVQVGEVIVDLVLSVLAQPSATLRDVGKLLMSSRGATELCLLFPPLTATEAEVVTA